MSRALSTALQALALLLWLGCDAVTTATLETGTDFTLHVASQTVLLPAGGQASAGVSVNWVGCPPRPVQLSLEGAPAGLTGSFDANPTPEGNTLKLAATTAVPPGTYTFLVRGQNNSLTHAREVTVTVPAAPDFSLFLEPAYLKLAQGEGRTTSVTIQGSAGFSGPVELSLEGGPAGVSGLFGGGSSDANRTLALSVGLGTTPGTYALTVKGTAAGKVRTTGLALTVTANQDFALGLNPADLSVPFGATSAGPVAVSIQRAAGFSGAVALSLEGAPAGVTATFSPSSTVGNASSLSFSLANLPLSPGSQVPPVPGSYALTIRGTGGGVSRIASLSLTLQPPAPDFSLPGLSFAVVQGGTGSQPVLIQSQGSFASPVTLSLEGAPAGVTPTFTPNPATPAQGSNLSLAVAASTTPGDYALTLRGISGALNHGVPLALKVLAAGDFSLGLGSPSLTLGLPFSGNATTSTTINITRLAGFSDPVTLSLEGAPANVSGTFTPNPATTSSSLLLTVGSGAPAGTHILTVRGLSGSLNHTATLTLTLTPFADFSLALNQASVNCAIPALAAPPNVATVIATVLPLGAFTGMVNLSVDGPLPTGVTPSFSANPLSSGTSTLALSVDPSASAGTFPLTIRGTSGSLPKTQPLTLILSAAPAPNFTIAPQFTTVKSVPGGSGSMAVTLTSLNGFSSPVTLDLVDSTNNPPAEFIASFLPPSPTPPANGTVMATLFKDTLASAPPGIYSLKIRGTAGPLVKIGSFTAVVQDYTLTGSVSSVIPSTAWIVSGTLTVNRLPLADPFTGAVNLTLTPPSSHSFSGTPTITPNPVPFPTTSVPFSFDLIGPMGTITMTIQGTSAGIPTPRTGTFLLTLP